jgi:hypothetical protein
VLVAPSRDDAVGGLLALAAPVAAGGRELLVARVVAREDELAGAVASLDACRSQARTAAFTSDDPPADLVRFATAHGADLVVVDAPAGLDGGQLPERLAALLDRSPAHVAVVVGEPRRAGPVFVPFGGGEHDWAALELGALLASATARPLRLLGTRADPSSGRRDASRLLADASLAVQRVVDVDVAPVLADAAGLVEAVEAASLVAVGISPRWRREGIGETRRALVRGAAAPVAIVCRGPGPGALAPRESRTRFTWTVGAPT